MGRCKWCGEDEGAGPHVCPSDSTARDRPERARATEPLGEAGAPDARPRATELRPGTSLAGRYRIEERVGGGGGGTVYRARDLDLDVRLAIKVLPSESLSDALVGRLKREIRIARDIDHPNVCRVFDLGEADGRIFLTMRWIDGEPLHERVRREGPLRDRDLARLAAGLVSALAAAHRLGVVHRDVKPPNVLVTKDGDPVLLDFGIATATGESAEARERRGADITVRGHVPGTPDFMAPEQKRGEETPAATDLWGLALTLAYAARGELGTPADLFPAFSRFPPPLSSLLPTCIEPDVGARPKDATVLEAAMRKRERRRRILRWAALATAALVLVASGALAVGRAGTGAGGPPLVRVDPFGNRTGKTDLDWLRHGAADLVAARFETSGRVRLATDDAARDRAHRVRGTIEEAGGGSTLVLVLAEPGGRVLARHEIRRPTGDALFDGVDEAVRLFSAALEVPIPEWAKRGRRPPGITRSAKAFALFARGQDLVRAGRYAEAYGSFEGAVERDPAFALAHLQRHVLAATGYGSRASAEESLERAKAHADRLPPTPRGLLESLLEARSERGAPDSSDRLRAHLRAHPPDGPTYWMVSNIEALDPEVRRALVEEWVERIPDDPDAHNQLGYLLLRDFDDAEGAEDAFRAYLRLAPRRANAHDSFADFLRARGRLDESLRAYDRALDLDPGFAPAALKPVEVSLARDDLPGARRRLTRAREIVSPGTGLHSALLRAEAAIPLLSGDVEAALARLETSAERGSGGRAFVAHEYRAIVLALEGRGAEAREAATESERLRRLFHGAGAPRSSLLPYVEGLATRGRDGARAIATAVESLDDIAARGELDAIGPLRRALLRGIALRESGDPSRAAEALLVEAPRGVHGDGAVFLAARERAGALVDAGRTAEAVRAFDAAIALRDAEPTTSEAAHEWRRCLEQAAVLARASGEEAQGSALEARLEALGR